MSLHRKKENILKKSFFVCFVFIFLPPKNGGHGHRTRFQCQQIICRFGILFFLVFGCRALVWWKPCCGGINGAEQWEGWFPRSLRQKLAKGASLEGGENFGGGGKKVFKGRKPWVWVYVLVCECVLFCFVESEVTRTRVAVVVELLLDVDHVAAGVFQLSELGPSTEVSEVTELR